MNMMMNATDTKIPFSIKNIAYDKVKAKTASQYLGVNNVQFKKIFILKLHNIFLLICKLYHFYQEIYLWTLIGL